MTNPVFESKIADIDTQASSATHTVNLSTHATGERLVAICNVSRTADDATLTCDTTGWDEIYASQDYIAGTDAGVVAVYTKVAASASETDPVFTCSEASALWCDFATSISGATDTVGDITKSIDLSQTWSTNSPTVQALTIAGGDNACIYYATMADNKHNAPVSGCAPPNSFTYESSYSGEGVNDCQVVGTGFASSNLSSGTWTNCYDGTPDANNSIFLMALGIPEAAAVVPEFAATQTQGQQQPVREPNEVIGY